MKRTWIIPCLAVSNLTITTASPLPTGEVTLPYSVNFGASGGTAPYTWLSIGTLPPGLSLSPTGQLTGTPTAFYSSSFQVQVTDAAFSQFTAVFSMTIVLKVGFSTTSPLPAASQSIFYSFNMAGTRGVAPYTWALLSQTGGNGWALNSLGNLTNTPNNVETDVLTIQITDSLGVTNTSTFSVQVNATSSSFDYYIAPNGDDHNNGLTPATAWSISAFNSKQSTGGTDGHGYAGKRIGVVGDIAGVQTPLQYGTIGGVQTTLYSMMNTINASTQNAALCVNGGTSSASTYVGSCDSSGVYKVGWAIFNAANPSTSTAPVGSQAIIMGQPLYQTTAVPNVGYVTLDGLAFTNFNYAAVVFGDVQAFAIYGVVIKNCKFYNGICQDANENPSMITMGATDHAQITNCLFNHGRTVTGTNIPYGMAGVGGYNKTLSSTIGSGTILTNCTFLDVGYSVRAKDDNQWGTYSYNYMDCGLFGSDCNNQNQNPIKGPITPLGQTLTLHHNIILGGGYWGWGEDGTLYGGAANFYNNTFYTPPAVTALALGVWFKSKNASTGTLTLQNNLTYYHTPYNNQGGPYATFSYQSGYGITSTSLDYNAYGAGTSFGTNNNVTLSGWQGLGYEAHSITVSNPFSGTPTSNVPTSFAITGPAATASSTGGPVGALDGTGTIGSSLT